MVSFSHFKLIIHEALQMPFCRALSVHITNDPWAEDESLEIFAEHYVTFEVLVSMYECLVVVNGLKSNKRK